MKDMHFEWQQSQREEEKVCIGEAFGNHSTECTAYRKIYHLPSEVVPLQGETNKLLYGSRVALKPFPTLFVTI